MWPTHYMQNQLITAIQTFLLASASLVPDKANNNMSSLACECQVPRAE